MKRLLFIVLIGFFIVLCFQLTGCSGDKPMVAYGSAAPEKNAGIYETVLEGDFSLQDNIETGLPTIIVFCTESCIGCKRLHKHFKNFVQLRPDVAILQILLPDNWQPQQIWDEHQVRVGATPHIIIYAPDSNLVVQDEGRDKKGFEFLYKWMNDEIQRDWKKRNNV